MSAFFSRLFGANSRPYETAEIYQSLRQQVFDLPKQDYNFGATDRLAVLMETGLEDACYTLVAVADGSASLYFSNGGGVIGSGGHQEGAEAAKALLDFSRKYDGQLKKISDTPLPKPGMTRFYIIKMDEILSGEFKENDLGKGKSPVSPLFYKAHELITVIRLIERKKGGEPGR
jgi:hypothetical protein